MMKNSDKSRISKQHLACEPTKAVETDQGEQRKTRKVENKLKDGGHSDTKKGMNRTQLLFDGGPFRTAKKLRHPTEINLRELCEVEAIATRKRKEDDTATDD